MECGALILGTAARAATVQAPAPRVSAAQALPLRAIEALDETGAMRPLMIPIERPLTLLLDGREIVTLMTLGAAPEWLAIGYLRNQLIVEDIARLRSVEVDWLQGTARIATREPGAPSSPLAVPAGSGGPLACSLGTVFTDIMRSAPAEAASAAAPARLAGPRVPHADLIAILDSMREHDAIHRAAGSVHSCALFHGRELWVAVEDVSRHNGVDTITGFMALHGVGGTDKILFTTGRLTGEMVMKAAHNGITVMVSRNGVTALGYDLGARCGMTLVGRASKGRYLCYVGSDRIER